MPCFAACPQPQSHCTLMFAQAFIKARHISRCTARTWRPSSYHTRPAVQCRSSTGKESKLEMRPVLLFDVMVRLGRLPR